MNVKFATDACNSLNLLGDFKNKVTACFQITARFKIRVVVLYVAPYDHCYEQTNEQNIMHVYVSNMTKGSQN